jgi:hypothetical protein
LITILAPLASGDRPDFLGDTDVANSLVDPSGWKIVVAGSAIHNDVHYSAIARYNTKWLARYDIWL